MASSNPPLPDSVDTTAVFKTVLCSAFLELEWGEKVEELRFVSKEWNASITHALSSCGSDFFSRIIRNLNEVNGTNKCSSCGGFCVDCACEKTALVMKDPRCQEEWNDLPLYNQAMLLYRFHASCVSNLRSFYGEDFTLEESLCADVFWEWEFMLMLQEYNPKAYYLFMGLIELHLAERELANAPYHYENLFDGQSRHPGCGSSFGALVSSIVWDLLGERSHGEPGEEGFKCKDWGMWYLSDVFDNLEPSCMNMLRGGSPHSLLGERLVNKIDIFYHVRAAMMPRLAIQGDIFPLTWPFEDSSDSEDTLDSSY